MNKFILYILLLSFSAVVAQEVKPIKKTTVEVKKYTITDILITGKTDYTAEQIIRLTDLGKGQQITIPSNKTSSAIKTLWNKKIFSKIDLFYTLNGDNIVLRYNLDDYPTIAELYIKGDSKKTFEDDLIKDLKLKENLKITPSIKEKIQRYVQQHFAKKGYTGASAEITETENKFNSKLKDLTIVIHQGKRTSIKKIEISGNTYFSDRHLKRVALKETRPFPASLHKKSKYEKALFEADLQRIIDEYLSVGYLDIKLIKKTVELKDDGYHIDIQIEEGNQYFLGNVAFIGNTVFPTDILEQIFAFQKGDPYDAVGIRKKITGSEKNDDLNTLYLDRGYLFAIVNSEEQGVKDNKIDLLIRIYEGKQATFDRITFEGNHITHDHVITRSLRTKPGDLFSKTKIIRTVHELARLGFFEPQEIVPDVQPNKSKGTVDVHWKLKEKSSSQIELQGGYGQGQFLGTLGITLNNFSLRNFLEDVPWRPSPMGDGQSLSLRAQIGGSYRSYSFGFTEPWIGGKRPASLSFGVSYSDYDIDNGDLNILSITLGTRHLLNWPDDYFSLSQGINYKLYSYQNYSLSVGDKTLEDGNSNNLNYKITLARRSKGPDPIFPTSGSDAEFSLKLTPPFSLLGGEKGVEKYNWLEYYKIQTKNYWYKQLLGKFVVKTGGELGFLGRYNKNLPVSPFERFFVGGTGLSGSRFDGRQIIPLRGYLDATTAGGGRDDITPSGGGVIYNKLSMELRYPITMGQMAKIYGIGFYEAAGTWSSYSNFNPFQLKRAAGIGIRMFMPAFGLLGLDYAYGFDSIDASGEPSGWQLHFIIGQEL